MPHRNVNHSQSVYQVIELVHENRTGRALLRRYYGKLIFPDRPPGSRWLLGGAWLLLKFLNDFQTFRQPL